MADVDIVEVQVGATAERLTKADWINLALEVLISDGIDQVKVQSMAKQLGVARSSFYWFFTSIQDLHDQLISHWLTRNTGPIIERSMRPAATLTRACCNVFECWIDAQLFDPNLDIGVRLWGRKDAKVREIVELADEQRVSSLAGMFRRYGIEDEEALTRARVLYFTQIGHYTLGVSDTLTMRLGHLRSYLLTFTGLRADDKEIKAFERYCAGFQKTAR